MNMTRFKLLVYFGACCLFSTVTIATGQNSPTVTAFESNGELTFSGDVGTRCTIEWASHPTSEWSRTWNKLDAFAVTSQTMTVKVPMFYRVVYLNPTLRLPFEGLSDMGPIQEAYSETTFCPWGFVNRGINFYPAVDRKPFLATASGQVVGVQLYKPGENWAVDVGILHDDNYLSGYTFNPMSSSGLDGSNQLENIVVSAGQVVAQGDIIGYLHSPSNGANVHYQLMADGVATCPEPHLQINAVTSILYLLEQRWPGASMCY